MENFIKLIDVNIKRKDLSSYLDVVKIAKDNIFTNPDICIESCKSLIEGISKTLILELDKSKRLEDIENLALEKLYKTAVEIVDKYNDYFETDFAKRFSSIVQIIGEIRNKRGDISHGRPAPKHIESDSYLSKLVYDLTDSFLEYLLKHFFDIEFNEVQLIYSELEEYNNYLDEQVVLNFPINTFKISEIIYERDPIAYRNIYYDEFLMLKNEEELGTNENDNQKIDYSEEINNNENKPKEKFIYQIKFEETIENKINEFVDRFDLKIDPFKDIVDDYIRFDIIPREYQIDELPQKSIKLSESKVVLNKLMENIKIFLINLSK